jgi:hypothetical protein
VGALLLTAADEPRDEARWDISEAADVCLPEAV